MSGLWLFTYMAIPTLISELALDGRLNSKAMSFTLMCATAASAVFMAACGHLSTFTGRRIFFIVFGLLGAILAPSRSWASFPLRTSAPWCCRRVPCKS
ncbi:MAG: transporter [Arthrobacter sp.]|nr:transporter [Arthrobacter sp.]MCU1548304.1 transporter [Arthrobacter sp.]